MPNYNLFISGFGSDLKTVMGISDGESIKYMGQWLVQSHNSILNLLLCFGYLPGVLYLFVLFNLVKKYLNIQSIEYAIGFLLYSFIIVLIAKKGLDVFWIYVLMIPETKQRIRLRYPRIRRKKIATHEGLSNIKIA
jgi:hypothetical protein